MTKDTLEEFQEIIIKLRKPRFELIDNVKTVILFDHPDLKSIILKIKVLFSKIKPMMI